MELYIERLIENKGYTIVLIEFSYFRPIVLYCIKKDRSNISPIRLCSLNLSCFSPIVWYCKLRDRSIISHIQLCSLILSTLDLYYVTVN